MEGCLFFGRDTAHGFGDRVRGRSGYVGGKEGYPQQDIATFLQVVWGDNVSHDDQELLVGQIARILDIETVDRVGNGLVRDRVLHRVNNRVDFGEFEGAILILVVVPEEGLHELELIRVEGNFVLENSRGLH